MSLVPDDYISGSQIFFSRPLDGCIVSKFIVGFSVRVNSFRNTRC